VDPICYAEETTYTPLGSTQIHNLHRTRQKQ